MFLSAGAHVWSLGVDFWSLRGDCWSLGDAFCEGLLLKRPKMSPIQGISRFFLILGAPGGSPNQGGRHGNATLWPLGKTILSMKSHDISLFFVVFRVLSLCWGVSGGIQGG